MEPDAAAGSPAEGWTKARVADHSRSAPPSGTGGTGVALKEPTWHRRNRAKRASARTILRVAAARRRVVQHHAFGKMQWRCPSCEVPNRISKQVCRKCQCPRPSPSAAPPWKGGASSAGSSGGGGKGKGGKGGGGGKGKDKPITQASLDEAVARAVAASLQQHQQALSSAVRGGSGWNNSNSVKLAVDVLADGALKDALQTALKSHRASQRTALLEDGVIAAATGLRKAAKAVEEASEAVAIARAELEAKELALREASVTLAEAQDIIREEIDALADAAPGGSWALPAAPALGGGGATIVERPVATARST